MNGRANMTALVTGASSGIGRQLAGLFAADGYDLILLARRLDALQSLASELSERHTITAMPFEANLADPAAAWHLFNALQSSGTLVDVVVNNAGFGLRGSVAELPLDRQLDMIQVNVTALTALTRLFLPAMLQRNRGGVLNVASTAAFQPGPLMAVYYATKAYAESFTEALAEEVHGTAVRVSCLCPGPTATEFAQAAAMTDSHLFRGGTMTSLEVARAGYEGWKRGDVLVVTGVSNRLGTVAARLLPRRTMRRITKRLNSRVEN
jgi:short-subunit dehydrogenase